MKPAVRIITPPTHREIATTTTTDVAETQTVFLSHRHTLIGRAWQFVRHIARLNEAKKFMMSCSNYLRNRISKIPIRITAN